VLRAQEEEKRGPVSLSEVKEVVAEDLDPWMLYLYAMKSSATKEKYLMRLGRFLDFVNPQEANKNSSLEEKARRFANRGRTDNGWALVASSSFCNFKRSVLIKER
jgi:hypothetical protein